MLKTLSVIMVVFMAATFAAAPAVAGSHSHARTGFYLGFGLGWGNAGADLSGLDPDRENSGSGNFRFGWALAPNVTLGLESSTWLKNYDITGTTAEVRLTGTVTALALTYFPSNVGAYIRGGIGVATGSVRIEDSGFSFDDTETGFGGLVALGYEWRLTPKFALGPQLQYAYLNIDGDGTESVDFVSATVQLNWYC